MEILIVDDERDLLESLRRGLNCLHHKTREVTSADVALNVLRTSPSIDLVITDHAMPGMSGMELVEWIRREKADLPVIIMTAFGDKDMVIRTLKNRWSGYIEKPFTLKELTDEIKRVTSNGRHGNDQFSDTFCQLAHQINNPLMAIMGSAELSLETDRAQLSRDGQERLHNIITAAQRINAINQKIMEFGKVMVEPFATIDIGVLLRQCLQMNSDMMLLKKIELHWMEQEKRCFTLGSNFALEQVFMNLLLNAIEAMERQDTRVLKVGVAKRPATDQVAVRIEDTGGGIAHDELHRIFDPYYTGKPNGTGIGLAVVKSIVDQFHGALKVDSKPGEGTCFTVLLPNAY